VAEGASDGFSDCLRSFDDPRDSRFSLEFAGNDSSAGASSPIRRLPAPHAADVNVNKIALGAVSNASAAQGASGIAEVRCFQARKPNVDRLGLHM
jgi:hypothetical protein